MPATKLIERSKEIMSGTPVFAGTRVPISTLLDYLEGGDRLDDFLDDFPTVNREQAIGVLGILRDMLAVQGDESVA